MTIQYDRQIWNHQVNRTGSLVFRPYSYGKYSYRHVSYYMMDFENMSIL